MLKNREILVEITNWILEKEIIILNGARQVGKTSLLYLLFKELKERNISSKQIFYLNLEEIKIWEHLNKDPENLLSYIIDQEKIAYFLIDEIQYLDNPSNFLKHIYDKYAPRIKIITTGSSSLELKAKFQDSLAGRKVTFLIKPLSFKEFLGFTNFQHLDYLEKNKLPPVIEDDFNKALSEYLIYGGMPAVVLQKNRKLKRKILEEYVSTYVNKDVRAIGAVKNISRFNNLVKILSAQIGNLLNINELCNTTGTPRRELVKYLDLLKYTFVLDEILPFKKNIRAQVTKMPKIYFFDLGIRNAVLDNFLDMESRQDTGFLFENFVFLELENSFKNKLFFYRTVSGSEIDFIIKKEAGIFLVEAKYKKLICPIDSRVLVNFIKREKTARRALVINLSYRKKDKNIHYIDYRDIRRKLD